MLLSQRLKVKDTLEHFDCVFWFHKKPPWISLCCRDVTPDEEHVPSVQDSEINLLKSGEVT